MMRSLIFPFTLGLAMSNFFAGKCGTEVRTNTNFRTGDPTQEVFILPAGYRGPFIAIYDQPNGQSPEWRGDSAIFAVPKNGVIRIKSVEPGMRTKTSHVFEGRPSSTMDAYPTCADMRVHPIDSLPAVCWLDFQMLGTGIPNHIVAVITDWAGIPENFERTTALYDSVLFGGKGLAAKKWEDPPDFKRKRAE